MAEQKSSSGGGSGGGGGGGSYGWVIPFVIILIVWYLIDAFSSPSSNRPSERSIGTTTENGLEGRSSSRGEVITNRRSNKDEVKVASSSEAELPESWPESLKFPSSANIENVLVSDEQNEKQVLTVSFVSVESVAEINDFYITSLADNGWETETEAVVADGVVISSSKPDLGFVTIFITKIGVNKTSTTLTFRDDS